MRLGGAPSNFETAPRVRKEYPTSGCAWDCPEAGPVQLMFNVASSPLFAWGEASHTSPSRFRMHAAQPSTVFPESAFSIAAFCMKNSAAWEESGSETFEQ